MNSFWGYANADVLALIVISLLSLVCLICAVLFVKNY